MVKSNGARGRDVVDVLTADHNEMVELIGQIKHAADSSRRRELADTLIAQVMRHAASKERYVFPVVEERVPNGADMVAHDKLEHKGIVEVMKEIEDLDASDLSFMPHVQLLEDRLRHLAQDEESSQFPQFRAHITREQLIQLGEKVRKARRPAKPRTYPTATHSALFHKTIGAGVGMVDRLRCMLTGRRTG